MGKTAKVVGGVRVMQFLSEEHDDGGTTVTVFRRFFTCGLFILFFLLIASLKMQLE